VNARDPSEKRPARPDASGTFTAPDQEDWLLWLKQ
jgi:hypothetical protein